MCLRLGYFTLTSAGTQQYFRCQRNCLSRELSLASRHRRRVRASVAGALRIAETVDRYAKKKDSLLQLPHGVRVQSGALDEIRRRNREAKCGVRCHEGPREPHLGVVATASLNKDVTSGGLEQILTGARDKRAISRATTEATGVLAQNSMLIRLRNVVQQQRRELSVVIDGVVGRGQCTAKVRHHIMADEVGGVRGESALRPDGAYELLKQAPALGVVVSHAPRRDGSDPLHLADSFA